MLTRMIYVSTAVGPVTTAVTGSILGVAQAHNAAHGITGVLCQGQGAYLQVLEGRRSVLDALYARIQADTRHANVTLRQVETIAWRRYGQWSMAYVDLMQLSSHPPQTLADFDLKMIDGQQAMARIDKLIVNGTVMHTPVV